MRFLVRVWLGFWFVFSWVFGWFFGWFFGRFVVGFWFVFGYFSKDFFFFWGGLHLSQHLGSIQQDFNSNDAFPLLEEYSLSAKKRWCLNVDL